MDKELSVAAGLVLALVVASFIGQFFAGVVIGVAAGYSIADRGAMAAAIWTKLRPHLDAAATQAKRLAGPK
ncbi:MAG: hypothetical protein WAN43_05530 [Rhodomicrobium sp.]